MTRIQFTSAVASGDLISTEERKEFERFFDTHDVRQLSVNYEFGLRNEAKIYKVYFDLTAKEFKMADTYYELTPTFDLFTEFKSLSPKGKIQICCCFLLNET